MLSIAARILNVPLLIHPGKAEAILWGLRNPLSVETPEPEASRFIGSRKRSDGSYGRVRQEGGVALIDIYGLLLGRGPWPMAEPMFGVTTYEGLRAQLAEAVADTAVHAIVLVIDSPGGEAGGMKAVADAVATAAREKRVVAVVDDMAASAAYGIASAASEIWVSQTSTVGSIGVVLVHMDHSGELQMAGVRPTIIKAGAKKATGNPFEPLSETDAADLDALVSAHYAQFIDTVAKGRGSRLSAKAARETEAAVFVGEEAIARGLADRIGTVEEAVSYLAKRAPTVTPRRAARQRPQAQSHDTADLRAFRVSLLSGKHPQFILAQSAQAALWQYAGAWGFRSAAEMEASGTFAVAEVDHLPRGVKPVVAGATPSPAPRRSYDLSSFFAAPQEPLGAASDARAAASGSWSEVYDAEKKRLGIR